ncbi:MAG TPA: hypothetical protein PLA44_14415 [Propionibacteriaceae bacterium]|nr:hypothetical protein [Propionibacteriaceae bacterium]
MRWRAIWLRAQLTGIAVSSMVWLVLSALEPALVALAWICGAALVATWPSRLVFRLRCGGRRVSSDDRQIVLRAVAPIQSLRGRREPEVLVSGRLSIGLVIGQHRLVVGKKLLNGLRTHQISELRFATLAARSAGVAVVNGSRVVAGVELFCLPWSLLQRLGHRLARPAPWPAWKSGIQRWIVGLVLALAAVDLYRRALWVSLAMVVLVGVAAVTTGRLNRAWAVRLAQLAEAEVPGSGLSPERPAEPDPWAFLFHDEAERRDRELWP